MFYIYRLIEKNPLFWYFQLHEKYIGFGERLEAEAYCRFFLRQNKGVSSLHVLRFEPGTIRPEDYFDWR